MQEDAQTPCEKTKKSSAKKKQTCKKNSWQQKHKTHCKKKTLQKNIRKILQKIRKKTQNHWKNCKKKKKSVLKKENRMKRNPIECFSIFFCILAQANFAPNLTCV